MHNKNYCKNILLLLREWRVISVYLCWRFDNFTLQKLSSRRQWIQLLRLLQVSDELLVAHQMLCSRLVDRYQQQQPSADLSVIDGHLSNYQTLVNSSIDSVITVRIYLTRFFLCSSCK